ncbi:hypothetical protein GCM10023144_47930 [Pigmentiphaga soli]|uniref:PIN domain-containing protein n=1 Tax=Pigmentiphaga soli TaxID=1007095 RepID=A0ABP8HTY2_9BURK
MRHSPFTAIFDACVLYPAPLRDFLMWLGLSGRFRARWSRDIHVLAAAIRCGASVIVTFNQRDFPANILGSYGVESQHPDEFVENFFGLDAAAVVARHSASEHNSKTRLLMSIVIWGSYFGKDWFRRPKP